MLVAIEFFFHKVPKSIDRFTDMEKDCLTENPSGSLDICNSDHNMQVKRNIDDFSFYGIPMHPATRLLLECKLHTILHGTKYTVKEAASFYKAYRLIRFPYCSAMVVDREDCCGRKPARGERKNDMNMCTQHYNRYILAQRRTVAMIVCLWRVLGGNIAEGVGRAHLLTSREFNTVWSEEHNEGWDS